MVADRNLQVELVKQMFGEAHAYAKQYQTHTPMAHFFNTRLQRVSELMGDFRMGRILDIGCGPAMIGAALDAWPIEYYGVDVSQEMIKEGVDRFGQDRRFRFSLGRIEELPFCDCFFDVVLCLGIIEYVLEGDVAISEIARVLKPKGIVIATMLNGLSPYRIWQRYIYWKAKNGIDKLTCLKDGTRNGPKPAKATVRIYGEADLRDLLTSKGLEIEDTVYYDFNVFFAPLDARFPRAAVFLSRKLEILGRGKLKFLGTGYIMKCRKNGVTSPQQCKSGSSGGWQTS
jgi:ubiquinone/menaquinone biosynthesis C-methylase UbiE